MSPHRLHARLTWAEVDARLEPDCRRIISAERQSLGLALRGRNHATIVAVAAEAMSVAEMWGVRL